MSGSFTKKEFQVPQPLVGLFPVPIVLITSNSSDNKANIMTAGWVGVVCSNPPMISLAIRPSRYSYKLIKENGEFVINIPSSNLLKVVDYCGTFSGRTIDKFKELSLTPLPAKIIQPPLIAECPVNIECKVTRNIFLGSHTLFIGEVITYHLNKDLLNQGSKEDYNINFKDIDPIVANLSEYWNLREKIGNINQIHNKIGI